MLDVSSGLLALADVHDRGILFEDTFVSWAEHVERSAALADWLHSTLDPSRPPHFGVLMDNVPEFSFLLGAASFSGSVLVGLNSTRSAADLERDIAVSDCQFVLTDQVRAVPPPGVIPHSRRPDELLMLIFTSGTSGEPKAVRITQQKVAFPGAMMADRFGLTRDDVVYVSMPMFHSNSIMAGWAVGLAAGCNVVLRRKFSASGFLPDVRKYGVTYANYVGKPLSYVLQTPRQPDDADNSLRIMFGNEGSARVVNEFAERFGVTVIDAFGSTEGGVSISADPAAPPGALGKFLPGIEVVRADDSRCAPGEIGEIVNTTGAGMFAGYYNDPAAEAERMRGGWFRTGDLAYQDDDGWVFYAGRTAGWLRVDGENLAVAPIERILLRYPKIGRVAVYGVPAEIGDRVMAAVVPVGEFDVDDFTKFLDAQPDLGPKQRPTVVRVCADLPQTATFKVLVRQLKADGLSCADPVFQLG